MRGSIAGATEVLTGRRDYEALGGLTVFFKLVAFENDYIRWESDSYMIRIFGITKTRWDFVITGLDKKTVLDSGTCHYRSDAAREARHRAECSAREGCILGTMLQGPSGVADWTRITYTVEG